MDDVALLIQSCSYTEDEIGNRIPKEVTREIFVRAQSITRAEYFSASQAGLAPDVMLVTAICDYEGETELFFRGERYSVYRTYQEQESDQVELYLRKKAGVSDEPVDL